MSQIIVKGIVLVIFGKVGAGKSQFSDNFSLYQENKCKIFEFDDQQNISKKSEIFNDEEYSRIKGDWHKMLFEFLLNNKEKYLFILVDNFQLKSMRKRMFKQIVDLDQETMFLEVSANNELCISRNENRSDPIPIEVLNNINTKYESYNSLTENKYQYEINLDLDQDIHFKNISELLLLIEREKHNLHLRQQKELLDLQKEKDHCTTKESVRHRYELSLRNILAEYYKSNLQDKKNIAKTKAHMMTSFESYFDQTDEQLNLEVKDFIDRISK